MTSFNKTLEMSFQRSVSLFLIIPTLVLSQWPSMGSQQTREQQNAQQYPRIKIGGPLGQLLPNGIQLGSGLGSLMNQLIGQSEQQQQQQSQPQPQYIQRPRESMREQYSPGKQFQQFSQQFSPQNFYQNQEGMFGSASSPLSGLSSGAFGSNQLGSALGNLGSLGSQLGSSLGSSLSSLGSTNSQLFSQFSSPVLGID